MNVVVRRPNAQFHAILTMNFSSWTTSANPKLTQESFGDAVNAQHHVCTITISGFCLVWPAISQLNHADQPVLTAYTGLLACGSGEGRVSRALATLVLALRIRGSSFVVEGSSWWCSEP